MNKNIIFAQKFRWAVESDGLPSEFISKFKFSISKKRIYLQCYDIKLGNKGFPFYEWLQKPIIEKLKFTTFDGSGDIIESFTFNNLKLIKHTSCEYDYTKSDAAITKIILSYEEMNNKEFYHKIKILDKEYNISLDTRPSIYIEEIEIPKYNGKIMIPGRAKWLPLTFTCSYDIPNAQNFTITMYNSKNIPVESWELIDASINNKENKYTVVFQGCKYNNLYTKTENGIPN